MMKISFRKEHMLCDLKTRIKQLAQSAVAIAEKALGSSKGEEKKKMAIEYIKKHLPFNTFFNGLIAFVLSGFIDNAVEYAVMYMNSLNNNGVENE